jgi:hypothetical protein
MKKAAQGAGKKCKVMLTEMGIMSFDWGIMSLD